MTMMLEIFTIQWILVVYQIPVLSNIRTSVCKSLHVKMCRADKINKENIWWGTEHWISCPSLNISDEKTF